MVRQVNYPQRTKIKKIMNNTFIYAMDAIFAAYNNATLVPNTLYTKSLNHQNS